MNLSTADAPDTKRRGEPPKKGRFGRDIDILSLLLEGRAFIALIVLVIIFALLSDSFLNFANLVTMTKHVAYNAILALGMLFVILKGGIDLSVGSTVGLSGVVAGTLAAGLAAGPLRHRPLPAGMGRRGRFPRGRRCWSGSSTAFSSPDSTSRPSSRRWACCTSRAVLRCSYRAARRTHGSPAVRNWATRASC